jgi:adenine-specific DNA-methyltransferase
VIDFKHFPTTRYQGSKKKILPWIYENLKTLDFHTVLDGFGGTGSVSYLFKKMGKEVVYNDILNFNYLIGKALIENSHITLNEYDINYVLSKSEQFNYKSTIRDTFKNIYYLDHENDWIDFVVGNIINMNTYKTNELTYKRTLAYYALFQACLIKRPFNLFHRKNLNIRTKDVVRNFGNKTTWEKSFETHFIKFCRELNRTIFDSNVKCKSLNKPIQNIDPYGYDLVYLDPPYIKRKNKNETSNYFKCYHFLEGLTKYNSWLDEIDFTSRNLHLQDKSSENLLTEKNAQEFFDEIICKFRKSQIVMSYKANGKPTIQTLVKIMKKYKRKVYTVSQPYKYALNKTNNETNKNREYLIIGI